MRVGFHSLRHSFVSLCAKAKTPLHVVQKLVGHGSPLLTSDVYLHWDARAETRSDSILSKDYAGTLTVELWFRGSASSSAREYRIAPRTWTGSRAPSATIRRIVNRETESRRAAVA